MNQLADFFLIVVADRPNFLFQVLDGVTLKNLDVLKNKAGGSEGTLLNSLDQCCTPFGKRFVTIMLTVQNPILLTKDKNTYVISFIQVVASVDLCTSPQCFKY